MAKTADYTKRAVDNYRNKFDMYQLRIPKDSGLKERMKEAYGKDMNSIILRLIEEDLNLKANNSAPNAENAPNQLYTKPNGTNNSRSDWEREEQERLDAIGRANLQEQLEWLKQQYPEYYKDAKLPTAPPDQEVPF